MAKKSANSTAAVKSPKAAAKVAPVTLRRLARDFGEGRKGETVLILNAAKFGSTGDNWLGGPKAHYATRELAMAAAAKAGAKVINPPTAA